MRRIVWATILFGLLSVGMASPAVAGDPDPATVVVHNDPPLTRGMIDHYTRFIQWLFDVEFSAAERAMLERFMVRHWTLGHRDDMRSVLQVLETAQTLHKRYSTPAEQSLVREQMLEPILLRSRVLAERDAEVRWLLDIYDRTHKPLIDGEPLLTRRALEARVNLLAFLTRESGVLPMEIDAATLQEMGDTIIAAYPNLDPARRRSIHAAPRHWAAIQFVWQEASESSRARYRAEWAAVAWRGLTAPQRRAVQAMREAAATMNSIPPDAMRHQVVRAADRLDAIVLSLVATEAPAPQQHLALARVLLETTDALRAAVVEPVAFDFDLTADVPITHHHLSAPAQRDLSFQLNLKRVHQQHTAGIRIHGRVLWQALWTAWDGAERTLHDVAPPE